MARWDGLYTPEILARVEALRDSGCSWKECADEIYAEFGVAFSANALRCKLSTPGPKPAPDKPAPPTIPERVETHKVKVDLDSHKRENKAMLAMLAAKDKEIDAALRISDGPQEYSFTPLPTKKLRTTQVVMWSDWHCEEIIRPESINHLNEFNEKVADRRISQCVASTARLMQITANDAPVDKVILHLGGDFITGNIHEEGNTWAAPIDAILWVQDRISAGIKHLLDSTPAEIVAVCSPGNHSRITPKTRYSNQQGYSLESMMYHSLRHHMRDKRLSWVIPASYHAYVDLYGKTLRFHHGDAVKYGGGVGGIFIPAYKAINQWNKARHADLDCFGHFHQLKNGGNFLVNGSLIGYNGFAVAIKADFERPYQKFFMFASTGEVIAEYPVFLVG